MTSSAKKKKWEMKDDDIKSPEQRAKDADSSAAKTTESRRGRAPPEAPKPNEDHTDVAKVVQTPTEESFVPDIMHYKDHFSLQTASSSIRFRDSGGAARVIMGTNSQFVLEEINDKETNSPAITLKKMTDASGGLLALRAIYTIETIFFLGFLLVLSLQLILFIFLDSAIYMGQTEIEEPKLGLAVGIILSLPAFIRALASGLTIAGHLVTDTWKGNPLVKTFVFGAIKNVATVEWMLLMLHLGCPFFIMCICLLAGTDSFWEVTSYTWFLCIFILYGIFAVNVIYYEMQACWTTMKNKYADDDIRHIYSYLQAAKQSIFLRQKHTFSGVRTTSFLCVSAFGDAEDMDRAAELNRENVITEPEERNGIILWLTKNGSYGLYETLDKPRALYTVEDAQDERPYVTSSSWSLEKAFCRPLNSRYVAILRGPGRVRTSQIKSTLLCSFLGLFFILLVLIAILVYMDIGGAIIAFIVAAFSLLSWSRIQVPIALFKLVKENDIFKENAKASRVNITEDNPRDRSEGVFFVKEMHRITEPTEVTCWTLFAVELAIFLVYPTAAMYSIGNAPMATLFFLFAAIYLARHYVSASCVLQEFGTMDCVGGRTEYDRWKKKSRLNNIVGNVTKASGVRVWSRVLGTLALLTAGIAFTAVGESTRAKEDKNVTYLPGFFYNPQETLQYPTCVLRDLGGRSMADYVFLANLAYQPINVTQSELDEWFGSGVAFDRNDVVDEFRRSTDNYTSAVVYKYFSIPSLDLNIVSIRGTQNSWDMLADMQLWSAASLMQFIRALLPLGAVFTPIMDELVYLVTSLESNSIERVSFYKPTSNFVNYLKEPQNVNVTAKQVQVTGHSLGGGLAIITGAKTGTPAVALSGPNAMISRKTFGITHEAIDTKTFNIIPERDVVPMLDDVGQLHQYIRCEADGNDFVGCHSSLRSLCEVLFTCGSGTGVNKRPVPCECVTLFKYPAPLTLTGKSFNEECGIEENE